MYGCCLGGTRREWEEVVASVAKIVKFLEDGHEIRNGMDQWTTKVTLLDVQLWTDCAGMLRAITVDEFSSPSRVKSARRTWRI